MSTFSGKWVRLNALPAQLQSPVLPNSQQYDLVSLLTIGGGAVAIFLALVADYFGTGLDREFGHSQSLMFLAGVASVTLGAVLEVARGRRSLAEALKFWSVVAQVSLLAAAFTLYHLENRAFYDFVMLLTLCGFVINHYLPKSLRLPFFFLLSMAGFWGIFGVAHPVNGLSLIGLGFAFFIICHLPIALWLRVTMLAAVGGFLASVSAGWIRAGELPTVLPILASIFMLRLAIYLYDLESGKLPASIWHRLSYFFMLPNAVFPFFPVIDSATFGRTYYNDDEARIYQRGARWMFRGFIHLLLYRLISSYFLLSPEEVTGPLGFLQYIVANFSLYFKISGLFHLIIGMLLLFGFNLPETHARYFFSSSFIDFWRRINIYWKDFMQKMVFTPTYLRLKNLGLGPTHCLVLSIAVVFFATWSLHAYQWFWLRGTALFTVPDIAFWSILAVLLILQTLHEQRQEAMPAQTGKRYLLSDRSFLVIRTLCTFLTICLLWSLWTSASLAAWVSLWKASGLLPALGPGPVTAAGWIQTCLVGMLVLSMVAIAAGVSFGLAPYRTAMQDQRRRIRKGEGNEEAWWRTTSGAAALAALVLVQLPPFAALLTPGVRAVAQEINDTRLSEKEHAQLERGYYEDLTNVNSMNSKLWHLLLGKPNGRPDVRDMPVMRVRDDYLDFDFAPNKSAQWFGATYAINRWGMRDKDYDLAKPAGAFRIAMLGSSREAGWGVGYDERFETLLENRLDSDPDLASGRKVEILNFSVDSYVAYHQLLTLNEKVWPFQVDAVFYMAGDRDYNLEELARVYKRLPIEPPAFLADVFSKAGINRAMPLDDIIWRLQAHQLEIVASAYKGIVEACRQKGVQPVWFYVPRIAGDDPWKAKLTPLAKDAGFVVVDLGAIFSGQDYAALRLSNWDWHPNSEGHRMIADTIYERLARAKIDGQFSMTPLAAAH